MFLFHLPSRRRIRYDFDSAQALENLNLLAQTNLQTVAHPDTVAYLLERMPLEGLERLRLQYIITFKEGSLADAYTEFDALCSLAPDQELPTTLRAT